MTTRDEVKQEIRYLILAFPNYTPILDGKPNTVDVFMDILENCDSELLHKAVVSCIKDNGRVFAPSVGEILERTQMFVAEEKMKFIPTPEPEGGWADLTGMTEKLFGDKK